MTTTDVPTPGPFRLTARWLRSRLAATAFSFMTVAHKCGLNALHRRRNAGRRNRQLEIGPGPRPIAGFEALNIVWTPGTTYVMRATRRMPFADGSFQTIYASHVLEHIPWYHVSGVLAEWYRLLEPGGTIELWVPDGLNIARAFVEAEDNQSDEFHKDGWWKFNDDHDPAVWANGRMFSYGDGEGTAGHFNWHLGLFSERYLGKVLEEVGFVDVQRLSRERVRGYDHGWINLGIAGTKQ